MARRRGGQKGSLSNKHGNWSGRFRTYSGKDPKEVTVFIGPSSMSREEAEVKLADLISADESRIPLLKRAGPRGMLLLQSNKMDGGFKGHRPGARGAAAELMVCADLLLKGFEVYRAMQSFAAVDLIATDESGKYWRVEVKSVTANARYGNVQCDVRRNIGKFDLIAFVFPPGRIVYRAPDQITDFQYPFGRTATVEECCA